MAKGLALVYLLAYNFACCAGWLYVLALCVKHVSNNSIDSLWGEVELTLKVVQTAAVLEIVHALVGLVKSPWFTTFLQVFSRVWVVWAVMHVAPPAQNSLFTVLTCASWGLVEVPRYLFYGLNLIDLVPYPLFWLRYSLFAVLYPTGITGELGCMYQGAMYLLGSGSFAEMSQNNKIIFILYVVVAITYIPGMLQVLPRCMVTWLRPERSNCLVEKIDSKEGKDKKGGKKKE